MSHIKPPLGVCPKNIHRYHRMFDLSRAIHEYIAIDRQEPTIEWIKELLELLEPK